MLTPEQRAETLQRFDEHRRAWDNNPALRVLYGDWYGRIAAELPPLALGPRVELGSGPGFARHFISDLELTDIVRAPWHDRELNAETLPYADASLGALILFDVLHHIAAPRQFFEEALRVLKPGGRIVMCEPYVSAASYPVYKLLHEEPVRLGVDPLADQRGEQLRDPFDSNQAIPTLMFGRARRAFAAAFPTLSLRRVAYLAGLSYPASGGFSGRLLLPFPLWRLLNRIESRFPNPVMRLMGFRMLVTLERVSEAR
jgi:SAM-dependent methyltransferase